MGMREDIKAATKELNAFRDDRLPEESKGETGYSEFISQLSDKYPGLREFEKQLMGFIRVEDVGDSLDFHVQAGNMQRKVKADCPEYLEWVDCQRNKMLKLIKLEVGWIVQHMYEGMTCEALHSRLIRIGVEYPMIQNSQELIDYLLEISGDDKVNQLIKVFCSMDLEGQLSYRILKVG